MEVGHLVIWSDSVRISVREVAVEGLHWVVVVGEYVEWRVEVSWEHKCAGGDKEDDKVVFGKGHREEDKLEGFVRVPKVEGVEEGDRVRERREFKFLHLLSHMLMM